ncbi:MAG: hypothetical protein R2834_18415 [Rhodothermales bacterium]
MTDGYHDTEDDDFSDLDEWLCEYVDGTIDPAARNALEECMRVNPALARHVQHLLQARNLLCRYGCRHQAPHGLQPRIHERLALESCLAPVHGTASLASRLGMLATVSSIVALSILMGNLDAFREPDRAPHAQIVEPQPFRPTRSATRASYLPAHAGLRPSAPSFALLSTVPRKYPQVPQALLLETTAEYPPAPAADPPTAP